MAAFAVAITIVNGQSIAGATIKPILPGTAAEPADQLGEVVAIGQPMTKTFRLNQSIACGPAVV